MIRTFLRNWLGITEEANRDSVRSPETVESNERDDPPETTEENAETLATNVEGQITSLRDDISILQQQMDVLLDALGMTAEKLLALQQKVFKKQERLLVELEWRKKDRERGGGGHDGTGK